MSQHTGQIELAVTRAGHLEVAVAAESIAGIRRAGGDDAGIPRLSLAACLGIAAPGAKPPTSFLQVQIEDAVFELGVDGKVKIRKLELSRLHRLPELVRGLGPRVGISGIIELEEGLAYYIDLDVMTRWVQREQQGQGEVQ